MKKFLLMVFLFTPAVSEAVTAYYTGKVENLRIESFYGFITVEGALGPQLVAATTPVLAQLAERCLPALFGYRRICSVWTKIKSRLRTSMSATNMNRRTQPLPEDRMITSMLAVVVRSRN